MPDDIYPEPRERSKSMGVMDSMAICKRGNKTRSSVGEILGSSLPLPSILTYIRRNSSIYDSLSSGIGSNDDLSSSEDFDNDLVKFNKRRNSSTIKDIFIPVPELMTGTQLPKTGAGLPTSPKSAPVSTSLSGKQFSLFGLLKGQNTVVPENRKINIDCEPVKSGFNTSQSGNKTIVCDSQRNAQNTSKYAQNLQNVSQTGPKTDNRKFTKVTKRELNFTSPVSF